MYEQHVRTLKKIENESVFEYEKQLRTLSRGGLFCPTLLLFNFVIETFRMLEYMSPTIDHITKSKLVRGVAETLLGDLQSECFC